MPALSPAAIAASKCDHLQRGFSRQFSVAKGAVPFYGRFVLAINSICRRFATGLGKVESFALMD